MVICIFPVKFDKSSIVLDVISNVIVIRSILVKRVFIILSASSRVFTVSIIRVTTVLTIILLVLICCWICFVCIIPSQCCTKL